MNPTHFILYVVAGIALLQAGGNKNETPAEYALSIACFVCASACVIAGAWLP